MDFRLSAEEETLRKTVEEFVRERLIPLEPQFEDAPDIFEGSRWKSRARLSDDPVIRRYVEIMEDLEKQAEAQGLWHLDVPKEYGGMQQPVTTTTAHRFSSGRRSRRPPQVR